MRFIKNKKFIFSRCIRNRNELCLFRFFIKNPSHVVLCLLFHEKSRCARTVRLKARLRRFALLLTFSVSTPTHGSFFANAPAAKHCTQYRYSFFVGNDIFMLSRKPFHMLKRMNNGGAHRSSCVRWAMFSVLINGRLRREYSKFAPGVIC